MSRRGSLSLVSLAAAAAVALASGTSHAWIKFKNNTPNMIFTAQDRTTVCEWECPNGFRAVGWWNIAPGGTANVWNATARKVLFTYFAEDDFGHFWNGSTWKHSVCTPFTVFGFCSGGSICNAPSRWLTYGGPTQPDFCCGLFCGLDETINFNL